MKQSESPVIYYIDIVLGYAYHLSTLATKLYETRRNVRGLHLRY